MKTMLLTLFTFLSLTINSHARSILPETASYNFGYRNETSGHSYEIKAEAYINGIFVVRYAENKDESSTTVQEFQYKSTDLDEAVMSEIKLLAEHLETAKIVTKKSEIVCRMFPSIEARIDFLTVGYAKKLVDGPKGCWVINRVSPKSEADQALAKDLKLTLKVLALNLVGSELK